MENNTSGRVGRPYCGLRCQLTRLMQQYPEKVAREVAYLEEFLRCCEEQPDLSLEDANELQARIRNQIRVHAYRINNDCEVTG